MKATIDSRPLAISLKVWLRETNQRVALLYGKRTPGWLPGCCYAVVNVFRVIVSMLLCGCQVLAELAMPLRSRSGWLLRVWEGSCYNVLSHY